jgi:hypothetical protein
MGFWQICSGLWGQGPLDRLESQHKKNPLEKAVVKESAPLPVCGSPPPHAHST